VTAQERLTCDFLMGWCMHVCYYPYEPNILARLSMVLSRIRRPMSMLCSTMAQSVTFDVVSGE